MADEISFEGREYISSKRASQLSNYAQDYIGYLARKGFIDAKRVGGLWYVSLESLNGYKAKAESYKPDQPQNPQNASTDADAFISFDGKQYVSASHAARTTGYHQDYVGQLARSGKVLSRQIGNRWYVDREAVIAHKEEKDSLLGAVQARSVGITRPTAEEPIVAQEEGSQPFFTYTSESKADLMPNFRDGEPDRRQTIPTRGGYMNDGRQVPIRVVAHAGSPELEISGYPHAQGASSSGFRHKAAITALALVIVLSLGFITYRSGLIYTWVNSTIIGTKSETASIASVADILGRFAEYAEQLLNPGQTYTRTK